MDFFTSMAVSSSALTAERTRMNLIANNLANAASTRTPEGGPYKRQDAVFAAVPAQQSFAGTLNRLNAAVRGGVEVTSIVEDTTPPRMEYNPTHPDADAAGYVSMPNVNYV